MKFSILYLLLLFSSISNAQLDFSLEPVPAHADTTAAADDFTAHAMLKNLSEETLVIAWQRLNNDIPLGWQSYICSNITCAPPDVSMGTFSITANDSTNLDCYFVPDGIPGNGTVEFRLFLIDDTTQVIYATYIGNASPVATFQPLRDQIKIYPNPATDFIIIESTLHSSIELFNIKGQLLQSSGAESIIDLSILSSGMYLLKVYGANKRLISFNYFHKIAPK